MQQIKFVLWERYRAWWGAHQLNEQDPFLLDRLKDEEKAKKLGMTIDQYRQHRATQEKKRRIAEANGGEKKEERAKRREANKLAAAEVQNLEAAKKRKALQEEQEQKDAEMLAFYQKLAGGSGPELAQLEKSGESMKSKPVDSEGAKSGEKPE